MKLNYRKYGNAGPPLIIVHGLYGSGDNWHSIAIALADNYEVFTVDQRNHGESPHDDVHDYDSMREDLLEFIKDQNLGKVSLIGHSMGGKTVMSFAMHYPDKIEALVVVDIAPIAYNDLAVTSHMTANHAKMIDAMLELDLKRMDSREEVSNALAVSIGSDRIRMFLLKNLTRNSEKEFCWKINLPALKKYLGHIMDTLPIQESIEKGGITGFPVYFIRGENSDYIQAKDHDTIKKLFPTAEIVSIPKSGHWVHAEQPELLVKNLKYLLG